MEDNKDLLNEIDKLEDNDEILEEKEKSTSHEKIFTIIVILIIVIALFFLYLSYKGAYIVSNKESKQDDFSAYLDVNNGEENENNMDNEEINYLEIENQKKEQFEMQKNNLVITSQMLDIDGKLIATIHNGNEENLEDVLVQVIFYNGEDKPIKIDEKNIEIFDSQSDYYMFFENTPKSYERCEFLISKENFYNNYNSNKNEISYRVEEKADKNIIEVSGKNNSDHKIQRVNFAVVYYNENNQIIAIRECSQYDIKKQKEFKIEVNRQLYSYSTFEDVPYTRFEVILLNAMSYVKK